MKKTKTRELVNQIVVTSDTPLTAYDIHNKLKDDKVTLSSIYRTLDTFCKEGIFIKDVDNSGVAIYTATHNHQHYLECKSCHKKIKINDCPYHKLNKKFKRELGFDVDEHDFVLYGTCKDCKDKK